MNAELVENFIGVAEVCLMQREAAAVGRECFARLRDRVRVLIERQYIGACFQNGFGVSAAADCSIDNQRARMWREQLDCFRGQDRTMVGEIFHFLRLLFQNERTGGKPNRTLKQYRVCVHVRG